MVDQTMADCDSQDLTEAVSRELQEGQAARTQSHHQGRFVHKPCEKVMKPRDPDVKFLNKLTNTLARTHLDGRKNSCLEDVESKSKSKAHQAEEQQAPRRTRQMSANEEPGTRKKFKTVARKARQAKRREALEQATAEQAKANSKARKTRSMTGDTPLGFDTYYFSHLGDRNTFMSNIQIRSWIESVFNPHLRTWYHDCLSMPSCQSHLEEAQCDPSAFAEAVLQEAAYQHNSARLVGTLIGEAAGCPTAFHLDLERRICLNFVQHTAMVASLVVRDGRRGGEFASCTEEQTLHRAAVMLLISMIVDLKDESGYFSRLLTGVNEGVTHPNPSETRVVKKDRVRITSKTIKFPSDLSEYIEKALCERKHHSAHCKFTFYKTITSETMCAVHLIGSKGQVRGMTQTIQKMVESSTK